MAIKNYIFDYGFHDASATFRVDTDRFTPEHARVTLEFFLWDYDKDGDPVDEVMKKYAIRAIKIATFNNYNTMGVIDEFNDEEGFCPIEGSQGLSLISVTAYEFDPQLLEMEIAENPLNSFQ